MVESFKEEENEEERIGEGATILWYVTAGGRSAFVEAASAALAPNLALWFDP